MDKEQAKTEAATAATATPCRSADALPDSIVDGYWSVIVLSVPDDSWRAALIKRLDGGPGLDFRQVEADATFGARADVADRAVLTLAENALNLRLWEAADGTQVSGRTRKFLLGSHESSCQMRGSGWQSCGLVRRACPDQFARRHTDRLKFACQCGFAARSVGVSWSSSEGDAHGPPDAHRGFLPFVTCFNKSVAAR